MMNEDLRQADWNLVYEQNDPNKAWEMFKVLTSNIFNRHAPLITKRINGRPCPWLTSNVRAELNDRDAAQRRWRRTKDEGDWNIYRRKKNRCTNRIRQARNNYYIELLTENQNNSKKFWNHIRKLLPKSNAKSNAVEKLQDNGTTVTSAKDKANMFCNYFADVARNLKKKSMPQPENLPSVPIKPSSSNQ